MKQKGRLRIDSSQNSLNLKVPRGHRQWYHTQLVNYLGFTISLFEKQTLPLDIHILFAILLCFIFASTDGALLCRIGIAPNRNIGKNLRPTNFVFDLNGLCKFPAK